METIGFIGLGKIGLPICQHLITKGFRVVGYRRSSLADFESIGGKPAVSAADVGSQSDLVFTCLPSDDALEDVIAGSRGLVTVARPNQIVVELGSHSVAFKEKYVDMLARKGAIFLDGEVSGTPGMVAQRKGIIYLSGDSVAAKKIEPVISTFAESCIYFGPFGAATKVKLVNNLLVGLHIAGTAQAMAIALKMGIDIERLIEAVATGSGGSTQFGVRASWMAKRRFIPQQGSAQGLAHYLDLAKEYADHVGVATPVLDCLIDIYRRAIPNIGDRDVAAILELFEDPQS